MPKREGAGRPKIEFDREKVKESIKGSFGIVSTIARKLGVSWFTTKNLIDADPEFTQILKEEEESVFDFCESTLLKSIRQGDTQSAKWILATKGKKRGYTEKQEIEHSGEVGVTILDDIK
jgi:hypothetical protein